MGYKLQVTTPAEEMHVQAKKREETGTIQKTKRFEEVCFLYADESENQRDDILKKSVRYVVSICKKGEIVDKTCCATIIFVLPGLRVICFNVW